MLHSHTRRNEALEELSSEFPEVPVRVVLDVFLSHLERARTVDDALIASRKRIEDACLL